MIIVIMAVLRLFTFTKLTWNFLGNTIFNMNCFKNNRNDNYH